MAGPELAGGAFRGGALAVAGEGGRARGGEAVRGGEGLDASGPVAGGAGRAVRAQQGVDVAADVVGGVLVDGDGEDAAGAQHPRGLGDDLLGERHQVQQPHRADRVEARVGERQTAGVGAQDPAGEAPSGGQEHGVGGVDAEDFEAGPGDPFGDEPGAAGEVEEGAGAGRHQAQHGRGRRLRPGHAAAGLVVVGRLGLVVEQGVRHGGDRTGWLPRVTSRQSAAWPGARASTRSASAKSFSVRAPPAEWVWTARATVS
ncbi:hypothetical protein GCM10010282_16210 [Streptomyces roseolus]|nr:hypothetical protein GCM10010282_16210 [Streptomyces roseolus]